MNADVSVVIPAYNPRAEWLDQAIRSAVDQAPPPLEVLVVDDGSDVPVECDHPLVRVIRQANTGVAGARNTGLREARGTYVAILDADDYWLPGKLARQVASMPGGAVLSTTQSLISVADAEPTSWAYGSLTPGGERDLLRTNRVVASTAMFRRDAALHAGGFPRQRLAEDWSLWLALSKRGEITHVPEPLAVYRLHDANASSDGPSLERAQILTLARHRTPRSLYYAAKQARHIIIRAIR